MTDTKQKPREWWISNTFIDEGKSIALQWEWPAYVGCTHVVEKAEYNKLLARIERMRSELRKALPHAPKMDGEASFTHCQKIISRVLAQDEKEAGV